MTDTVRDDTTTDAVLPVNTPVTSNIDSAADADWWQIQLTAGVTYLFDMLGVDEDGSWSGFTLGDPFLALRDSAGITIASDDDAGLGRNARILFTPSQSGTYYLDAHDFEDGTGIYTLVANASPVVGDLGLATPVTGSIEQVGNVNLFSIALVAGQGYLFTLDGSTLEDPFLEVLDATGAVVDYDDDSGPGQGARLPFVPATSGAYFVAVRSSGNAATGAYSLQAIPQLVLSIADATVTEGNSGVTPMQFVITLSEPSATPVTVTVETFDDTAQAGQDYVRATSTVTFSPGQTQATFTVSANSDAALEPNEHFFVDLWDPVGAILSASAEASGWIGNDDTQGLSLPLDEGLALQWYLYGAPGVNAIPVWASYTGHGVKVGVFDQGVDAGNSDLLPNVLTALGRRALDLAPGGAPELVDDNHGTTVAGVIAAAANGSGEVGVAPGASIVSIYSDLHGDDSLTTEIANAFTYARGTVDVLNNSWGFGNQFFFGTNYAFSDDFSSAPFEAVGQALKRLADEGRDGLGTVVVQSAGNAFGYGDDTNLHNLQNSRYIVTVGGTTVDQHSAWFSSPGASLLVSAPSGSGTQSYADILTTDRTGTAGYDPSDSTYIAGTSFSAPLVSGVVALMLEANPKLGYRDVQEILAYTAKRIATDDNTWAYNGADNWNGGGLHYDSLTHDLGFGLVDARAAVRLAETWTAPAHTSANAMQTTVSAAPHLAIPDDGLDTGAAAVSTVNVSQGLMLVERAEVTLNLTHSNIGDLYVVLTSPSGTQSFLLAQPGAGALSPFGSSQSDIHFTFDTVLGWGEHANGKWRLSVFDAASGDVGTLDSWSLTLIGAPMEPEMTWIYTDEFGAAAADEPARAMLTDMGGDDTLNASAVSTNSRIDLFVPDFTHGFGPGSRIAGRTLQFGLLTKIKNAYGGDGNDSIQGNFLGNMLYGMRGNDTIGGLGQDDSLTGGGGNDSLDGGAGTDTVFFTGTRAQYALSRSGATITATDLAASRDGTDTISTAEILHFSDRSVDLGAGSRAATVSAGDLKTLEELYVGFFNRVPEASGLGYWIGQHAVGVSLTDIANQFYSAGVQFGVYSAGMTNTQFIQAVYANVLYRPPGSATEPDAQEIGYWNSYLTDVAHPQQTKGTMVLQMLHDVHENFEHHAIYGFVAASLNNKAAVANYYAVQQGLEYYTSAQNIAFGTQLASLITATDITAALALVGLTEADFSTL